MSKDINKNIDYKLRNAYIDLIRWVDVLGDELQKNYECMYEIRQIQDVDHDKINSELDERSKDLRFNFSFFTDMLKNSSDVIKFYYKILEKYFYSKVEDPKK